MNCPCSWQDRAHSLDPSIHLSPTSFLPPSVESRLQIIIIITMCRPSVVGQTSHERYLPNLLGETSPSAAGAGWKLRACCCCHSRCSQTDSPACAHPPSSSSSVLTPPFVHICSVWSSSSLLYPPAFILPFILPSSLSHPRLTKPISCHTHTLLLCKHCGLNTV